MEASIDGAITTSEAVAPRELIYRMRTADVRGWLFEPGLKVLGLTVFYLPPSCKKRSLSQSRVLFPRN